jgi:putative ABC transport system ATP-binding protein
MVRLNHTAGRLVNDCAIRKRCFGQVRMVTARNGGQDRLADSEQTTVSLTLNQMAILSLRNVTKDYVSDGQPVRAVDGVTLEVAAGEFVALVGRSGCGKSTLLNLAGAMDFPSSGEVRIEKSATTGLADAKLTQIRREKIGFIFQSFQLLHTLSVFENVELPLLLAGRDNARDAARERLRWVELEGLGERLPHQLSGGQMQRVAIARAMVHSPKILLADEPTGNLDTVTGDVILTLLRRLTREHGTALLMATHSVDAAELADVIVRMRDGKIENLERRAQ